MTTADPISPMAKDFFRRVAKMYEISDDLPTEIATFWHSAAGEGPEGWTTDELADFDLETLRAIPQQLGRLRDLAEDHGDGAAFATFVGMGVNVELWLMGRFPEYAAEASFRQEQDEAKSDSGPESWN